MELSLLGLAMVVFSVGMTATLAILRVAARLKEIREVLEALHRDITGA